MKNATRARVLCGLLTAVSCVPEARLHETEQTGGSGAGSMQSGGTGGKGMPKPPDNGGRDGGAAGAAELGGAAEGGDGAVVAAGEAGAAGAPIQPGGFASVKFCQKSTPNTGDPVTLRVSQGDTYVDFSAKPGECDPAPGEPCRTVPAGEVLLSQVIDGVVEPLPFVLGREPITLDEGAVQLVVLTFNNGQVSGSIAGQFTQPSFCDGTSFDSLFPPDCPNYGPVLGPPSCACLDYDVCGAKTDCCRQGGEAGGPFNRGNSPAEPARVSAFALDQYEINVGRFRRFLEHYAPPLAGSGKNVNDANDTGWDASWSAWLPADASALSAALACDPGGQQTWTAEPGDNEGMPMNCLTWFEAQAFCIWDGGRLPTEAEWNFAAAAGAEQRLYPWSYPPTNPAIDASHANYSTGTSSATLLPVGSKPAGQSARQLEDLAGNVAEWVEDWYSPSYVKPCHDCGAFAAGTTRAVRGGSYLDSATAMSTAYRTSAKPDQRSTAVGARCARSVL